MQGWIKLKREVASHWIFQDSETFHIWCFLLLNANHVGKKSIRGNSIVDIKPGQLLTSRKAISSATGINESKIQRVLKLLESEKKIEQQTNSKNRIITVTNWKEHQEDEQQMNDKRTASEQQVNTTKKEKNDKNKRTPPLVPPPGGKPKHDDFLNDGLAVEPSAQVVAPTPKEGRKSTQRSRLPQDFVPPDSWLAFALSKGLSQQEAGHEWQKFRDHHIARATLSADWTASWRVWIRKAIEFQEQRRRLA